ncbi:MAG: hypothetical protein ABIG66_01010 [Candidatus Kerfeldbacteria bacterium]
MVGVKTSGICTTNGCREPVFFRGLCHAHWVAWQNPGAPVRDDTRASKPAKRTPRKRGASKKKCLVPGCETPAYCKGFCTKHYTRLYVHGNPLHTEKERHDGCSVEGCDGNHRGLSYCSKHLKRFQKHGDPLVTLYDRKLRGTCMVESCSSKARTAGMCNKHYRRWLQYGDPEILKQVHDKNPPEHCAVPGCEREYYARGFCSMHYTRWKRTGDPLLVQKSGRKADR